jgi:biotin carboxyl carrier protein
MSKPISVMTEVTGSVWTVEASPGQQVEAGDCLMIIESMKMEIPVEAPCAGVVSALHRSKGDMVSEGDVVALIVASGG